MLAPEHDAERFRALEHDPRLLTRPGSEIFANRNGIDISCDAFLADIVWCAEQLPEARYCINLCTDRYRFTTAFFAAALRGQTTLLPSQRTTEALNDLRDRYPECTQLADNPDTHCDALIDFNPGNSPIDDNAIAAAQTAIDPEQVVAIAFTSGSTGAPQAHAKSWKALVSGRATHARYLALTQRHSDQINNGLIATVPCWHMYGLEWALLLPTVASYALHCGADFFPGDVRAAIERFDRPTVLVTTPVHLRALLKTPAPSTRVTATVCATAPLDATLTNAAEAHLNSTMFEIYGCSEIGSLAWRQPAQESGWEFFDNLKLQFIESANGQDTTGALNVTTEFLDTAVTLGDHFGRLHGNRYKLLGRATDLVKVAGKRESLANLNNILLALPDVDDGVIYQPAALAPALATNQEGEQRLAAFVVGSNVNVTQVRQALATKLDPAFVPRPIRVVDSLPRDSTSKLKISSLAELVLSYADD